MNLFAAATCPATAAREAYGYGMGRFAADSAGSELVEYALCVGMLLMVIFGIIDCSRLVYTHHFIAEAAEASVRYASTRGSTWPGVCTNATAVNCVASATNVSNSVLQTAMVEISPAQLTVAPTWAGTTPNGSTCSSDNTTNAPGCVVTVKVSYVFQFALPFLPHMTVPMSSSASGVIQQ